MSTGTSQTQKIWWMTLCIAASVVSLALVGCTVQKRYEPTWESLKRYETPQWLRDGKFGIYTH